MRFIKGFVDGILVEIYERSVKDEEASAKSELPIYRSAIYVKKKIPNSRDIYDQPLKSKDRERYAEMLIAFEKGEQIPLEGTPIEQWPALDVTQVATLKAANVFTVQSLADLAETGMHRLPTGYANLKTKAQKWLNQGKEVELLRQENAALLKRVEALESNEEKRGPGRPKKAEVA